MTNNIKHIFHINNQINLLVSLRIISDNNLSAEQCIIMYDSFFPKNIQIPANLKVIECPFSNNLRFLRLREIIKIKKTLSDYDNFISKIFVNSYYYYVAHLGTSFNEICATHKLCLGFFFTEEGLLNYKDNFIGLHANTRPSLYKRLVHWMKFGRKMQFSCISIGNHQKLISTYSISEKAFPTLTKPLRVISDLFQIINFDPLISDILVLDNFYLGVNHMFHISSYLLALNEFLGIIKTHHVNKLHMKYHLAECPEYIKKIIQFLFNSHNIEMIILPDNLILENLAYSNNKIIFYSAYSSLLIYAAILGAKAISYVQLIEKYEPSFSTCNSFSESYSKGYLPENIEFIQ